MGVKIWNPGTDDYDDYAGTPEYIQVGDLPTVTPKWIPTEAVDETLGRFDVDVLATDAEVVHDTGNETGIAGDKEWVGSHAWEYGADGKVRIFVNAAEDSPGFGLYRSGDTLPRVSISAPMSLFGLGIIAFSNGITGGASLADNGSTALVVNGRDSMQAPSFVASGKTGANATPMIPAGGTASGAPASGAHLKGELVCDDAGVLYRCTVAGTPGTWVQVNSTVVQPLNASLTDLAARWNPAGSGFPSILTFRELTGNGTNTVALVAPGSIASDKVVTFADASGHVAIRSVVTKTTTYTALNGEVVFASASGGGWVLTLPAVLVNAKVTVKKTDATANAITVTPASGTIDGAATHPINVQYTSREFVSDGTNWFIV